MSCPPSVQNVPSVKKAKERVQKAVAAVKGTSTKRRRLGEYTPREKAHQRVNEARRAYNKAMAAAHKKQASRKKK